MPLATLSNWDDTRIALHQSMQVLRSARLLGVDPLPNSLEYGTIPMPYGATTGPLKFGGELLLDFAQAAIVYRDHGKEVFRVGLAGHNQTSLFDTVFAELAKAGLKLDPNRGKITNTTPFKISLEQVQTYTSVMWRMYTALARFRAHVYGWMSPVVMWPHGFDLSFLWFARGSEERSDPHLNFGFSPGTPDIGQPYVYFYAYPAINGLDKALPSNMRWHTAWSSPGGVLEYDKFASANDPEAVVEDTLLDAFRAASALMK
jgi:hypothetical protein